MVIGSYHSDNVMIELLFINQGYDSGGNVNKELGGQECQMLENWFEKITACLQGISETAGKHV